MKSIASSQTILPYCGNKVGGAFIQKNQLKVWSFQIFCKYQFYPVHEENEGLKTTKRGEEEGKIRKYSSSI